MSRLYLSFLCCNGDNLMGIWPMVLLGTSVVLADQ
jgi:hypothetical protein